MVAKHLDNPPKCIFEDLLKKLAVFDPEYDIKGKLVCFNNPSNNISMSTVYDEKESQFHCNIEIINTKVILHLDKYILEIDIRDLEDNIIRKMLVEARDKYLQELRGE